MFQSPALWPHMTLWQNAQFAAPKGSSERMEWLFQRLGIHEIKNRKPHQISGGQARRASLARTLAARKPVLLLDEPFAHLGQTLAKQAAEVVLKCTNEDRATLVIAGHDAYLAEILRATPLYVSEGDTTMAGEYQLKENPHG